MADTVHAAGVRERYRRAGQEHVLVYIDTVTDEERFALLKQLDEIQVENLSSLLDAAATQEQSAVRGDNFEPFRGPIGRCADGNLRAKSRAIGMEAIKNNHVAALVRWLHNSPTLGRNDLFLTLACCFRLLSGASGWTGMWLMCRCQKHNCHELTLFLFV